MTSLSCCSCVPRAVTSHSGGGEAGVAQREEWMDSWGAGRWQNPQPSPRCEGLQSGAAWAWQGPQPGPGHHQEAISRPTPQGTLSSPPSMDIQWKGWFLALVVLAPGVPGKRVMWAVRVLSAATGEAAAPSHGGGGGGRGSRHGPGGLAAEPVCVPGHSDSPLRSTAAAGHPAAARGKSPVALARGEKTRRAVRRACRA